MSKQNFQFYGFCQMVLIDSDGKVVKLYKAKTTPHMFIVDKDGAVVYQGAIDNKVPEGKEYVNYADKALNELLADKPVTIAKTKSNGCSVKYAKSMDV